MTAITHEIALPVFALARTGLRERKAFGRRDGHILLKCFKVAHFGREAALVGLEEFSEPSKRAAVHVVAGLVEVRKGVEMPETRGDPVEFLERVDFAERRFRQTRERAVECSGVFPAGNRLDSAGPKHVFEKLHDAEGP